MKIGTYKHYKGEKYKVIAIVKHTETMEELVIYEALYTPKEFGENTLLARPKKMFLENIEKDGKIIPRFKYIET